MDSIAEKIWPLESSSETKTKNLEQDRKVSEAGTRNSDGQKTRTIRELGSGLFDASGFCTVEDFVETGETRFIVIGFDFATVLFSSSCSCILFAIVLVQLVKLKF